MIKSILITGASGVLGSGIINTLNPLLYRIYIIGRDKKILLNKFPFIDKSCIFDNKDINKVPFNKIDFVIHTAFSRTQIDTELKSSIEYSKKIFEYSVKNKVPAVINISSQSIYGNNRILPSKETDEISPLDKYALAKYECEKLANKISLKSETKITNIRLSSLIGPQFNERLINKMIINAINNKIINIVGEKQVFSFLDIRDAINGIISMLKIESKKWRNIYNLGTFEQYSIKEIAEIITKIIPGTKIELNRQDINTQIRLDCSCFFKDFNWKPKYNILNSIKYIESNIND